MSDLILIKMKWVSEFMIAAAPRNSSVSLLSPGPEGYAHLSEQPLGPDEGCSASKIFIGLREGKVRK